MRPTRPDPGLPVPPYWSTHAPGAPGATRVDPPGGGPQLLEAAACWFARRGLTSGARTVAAAPGAELALLALLAATRGDLVLARPAAAWQAPVAALLGRRVHRVLTPAEGGGVPDPVALLETVRRARSEGGDPRLVLLSAADDPTGTVSAPEPLRETCEAAAAEDLLVVSDETYAGTLHDHGTVLVGPAELLPERTAVLVDLGATLVPAAVPVAIVRFPATGRGAGWRRRTADVLGALRAALPGPVAAATAYALGEPPEVTGHLAAASRLHAQVAAAAHRAITGAGALCRPPEAGFHLYPELDAPGLDAAAVEARLSAALGRPVLGGHRFGDDPAVPRARIDTGALYGATETERRTALAAGDPVALPHVAAALTALTSAFVELTAQARDAGPATGGSRGRGG